MDKLKSQRFEEALQAVAEALHKKGGTKTIEKVHERIGRLKERFPSVHRYYSIRVKAQKGMVVELSWKRKKPREGTGVYFIRTSLKIDAESKLWHIYNTIREIEATFRCLKTDLKMRPIFHQLDIYSLSHLFVSVLAYQVVNTIRYSLKQKGLYHDWQNIVRIMNSQKATTTSLQLKKDHRIHVRKCSEPNQQVKQIYDALGFKDRPYTIKKFVLPES
jgi:hypothetical protein